MVLTNMVLTNMVLSSMVLTWSCQTWFCQAWSWQAWSWHSLDKFGLDNMVLSNTVLTWLVNHGLDMILILFSNNLLAVLDWLSILFRETFALKFISLALKKCKTDQIHLLKRAVPKANTGFWNRKRVWFFSQIGVIRYPA